MWLALTALLSGSKFSSGSDGFYSTSGPQREWLPLPRLVPRCFFFPFFKIVSLNVQVLEPVALHVGPGLVCHSCLCLKFPFLSCPFRKMSPVRRKHVVTEMLGTTQEDS